MEELYKIYLNRIYDCLGKPVPEELISRYKTIQSFMWATEKDVYTQHDLAFSQIAIIVAMLVEQYERENS